MKETGHEVPPQLIRLPKPDDPTALFYFDGIPDISLSNVNKTDLNELKGAIQSGVAKVKWKVCNTICLEAGRLILVVARNLRMPATCFLYHTIFLNPLQKTMTTVLCVMNMKSHSNGLPTWKGNWPGRYVNVINFMPRRVL